jgi:hypothetical protein
MHLRSSVRVRIPALLEIHRSALDPMRRCLEVQRNSIRVASTLNPP